MGFHFISELEQAQSMCRVECTESACMNFLTSSSLMETGSIQVQSCAYTQNLLKLFLAEWFL